MIADLLFQSILPSTDAVSSASAPQPLDVKNSLIHREGIQEWRQGNRTATGQRFTTLLEALLTPAEKPVVHSASSPEYGGTVGQTRLPQTGKPQIQTLDSASLRSADWGRGRSPQLDSDPLITYHWRRDELSIALRFPQVVPPALEGNAAIDRWHFQYVPSNVSLPAPVEQISQSIQLTEKFATSEGPEENGLEYSTGYVSMEQIIAQIQKLIDQVRDNLIHQPPADLPDVTNSAEMAGQLFWLRFLIDPANVEITSSSGEPTIRLPRTEFARSDLNLSELTRISSSITEPPPSYMTVDGEPESSVIKRELIIPVTSTHTAIQAPPRVTVQRLRQAQFLMTHLSDLFRDSTQIDDEANPVDLWQMGATASTNEIQLSVQATDTAGAHTLDLIASTLERELADDRLRSYVASIARDFDEMPRQSDRQIENSTMGRGEGTSQPTAILLTHGHELPTVAVDRVDAMTAPLTASPDEAGSAISNLTPQHLNRPDVTPDIAWESSGEILSPLSEIASVLPLDASQDAQSMRGQILHTIQSQVALPPQITPTQQTMHLSPALGTIDLHVVREHETFGLQVQTRTPEAQHWLVSEIDQLKTALQADGIELSSVEILTRDAGTAAIADALDVPSPMVAAPPQDGPTAKILSPSPEIASASSPNPELSTRPEIRTQILQAIQSQVVHTALQSAPTDRTIYLPSTRVGEVVLHIAQEAGKLDLQMQAQTPEAQRQLMREASLLKAELQASGIEVTRVEVSTQETPDVPVASSAPILDESDTQFAPAVMDKLPDESYVETLSPAPEMVSASPSGTEPSTHQGVRTQIAQAIQSQVASTPAQSALTERTFHLRSTPVGEPEMVSASPSGTEPSTGQGTRTQIVQTIQSQVASTPAQPAPTERTVYLPSTPVGEVVLHIAQEAGKVDLQMQAQTPEAQGRLMREVSLLKAELQAGGIELTSVEVSSREGTHESDNWFARPMAEALASDSHAEMLSPSHELASASSLSPESSTRQGLRTQIVQTIQSQVASTPVQPASTERPVHLLSTPVGEVVLRIAQEAGKLDLQMQAQTPEAQQQLVREVSLLRTELQASGIEVTQMEVSTRKTPDIPAAFSAPPLDESDTQIVPAVTQGLSRDSHAETLSPVPEMISAPPPGTEASTRQGVRTQIVQAIQSQIASTPVQSALTEQTVHLPSTPVGEVVLHIVQEGGKVDLQMQVQTPEAQGQLMREVSLVKAELQASSIEVTRVEVFRRDEGLSASEMDFDDIGTSYFHQKRDTNPSTAVTMAGEAGTRSQDKLPFTTSTNATVSRPGVVGEMSSPLTPQVSSPTNVTAHPGSVVGTNTPVRQNDVGNLLSEVKLASNAAIDDLADRFSLPSHRADIKQDVEDLTERVNPVVPNGDGETRFSSSEITTPSPHTGGKSLQEARAEIIQAVLARRNANTTAEYKEMTIRLRPPHLGRLIVKIVQENDEVTVRIQARTHQAQQWLMSELSQLKSELREQGVNLTNLEVSLGGESDSQQSKQGHEWLFQNQQRSGQWPGTRRRMISLPPDVDADLSLRSIIGGGYVDG